MGYVDLVSERAYRYKSSGASDLIEMPAEILPRERRDALQSACRHRLTHCSSEARGRLAHHGARARDVYDAMVYDGPGSKPEWVVGGNSLKQDEARQLAAAELEAAA